MSFQSVKTLCKVGALTALGGLCFKIKDKLSENSANQAQAESGALLIVQNIKHSPWLKFTAVNHSQDQQQEKLLLGTNINGHNVSMLTASHVLMLKKHAAESGLDIRVAGELIVDMNSFIKLEPQSEQAKLWLDKNGAGYGFIQAVNAGNQPITGLYNFSPLGSSDLSSEILRIDDIYSRLLITTTSGLENPKISPEEYSKNSPELLALGILPEPAGKEVRLHFNFTGYSHVISDLIELESKSIKLVPADKTIYQTLTKYYPEITKRADFSAILESVVRINSALLNLEPSKITSESIIALPVIDYVPSESIHKNLTKQAENKKTNKTQKTPEFSSREILACKKIAVRHKILGNEHITGIVTHRLESGERSTTAIAKTPGDPGGASYGRCQLSGKKGSLTNFVNFCLENNRYSSIGQELKSGGGLKGVNLPADFDSVWLNAYKKNPALFKMAETDFIKQTIEQPSLARAKAHGINTDCIALKGFIYSLATQYGIPDARSSAVKSEHKFDEICRAAKPFKDSDLSALKALLETRSEVMLRMAAHQESIGQIKTAKLFRSIVNNRYPEEAKLLKWLYYTDNQI